MKIFVLCKLMKIDLKFANENKEHFLSVCLLLHLFHISVFMVGLAFKAEIKESKGVVNGSHICYTWNQNISVSDVLRFWLMDCLVIRKKVKYIYVPTRNWCICQRGIMRSKYSSTSVIINGRVSGCCHG